MQLGKYLQKILNTEVHISNSVLIDNWQSIIYSDTVTIENNKLYGDRDFYLHGNNLTYRNNTHNAKELNAQESKCRRSKIFRR